MTEFRLNYTKTIHGYRTVNAPTIEEATKLLESGEADEFDNKSDYNFTSEAYKA